MIKKLIIFIVIISPLFLFAQQDSIKADVYAWPVASQLSKENAGLKTAVLFEGSSGDFSWVQMNAAILKESKVADQMDVPAKEEQLYIVKDGTLTMSFNDSVYTLVPGSIALLLPGEKFSLQNKSGTPCEFYVMKYRSAKVDEKNNQEGLHSFVKEWDKIPFHSHDKGGVRNFFETPTSMAKRMEMHVSTLNPGLKSHDPHTHRAAEIVLVKEGNTKMQIGEKFYEGEKGSIYFLSSNILHAIQNSGAAPATYFAFQLE